MRYIGSVSIGGSGKCGWALYTVGTILVAGLLVDCLSHLGMGDAWMVLAGCGLLLR